MIHANLHNLIRVAAGGLLAQIALAPLLWFPGKRLYPLLPVFGLESPRFAGFDWLPGAVLVICLIALLIFPRKKILLAAAIALLSGLILLDLTRLQVWVWFYTLIFGATLCENAWGERGVWSAARWLLAGVYFWSGFHKFNPYFVEDVFPWFCEAFSFSKSFGSSKTLAVAAALGELFLGLGLLFSKSRPVFRWVAVAFHLFIVLTLSPLGHNWNLVVIPWNVAMAMMVWLVFSRNERQDDWPFFSNIKDAKASFVLFWCLVWVAPAFKIAGFWPENMAWTMYSGVHAEATFYWEKGRSIVLPDAVKPHVFGDSENRLILDDWALREVGVAPFSGAWPFHKSHLILCGCVDKPENAGFYILTADQWDKSKEKMVRVPCRLR